MLADLCSWGCTDFDKVAPLAAIHTVVTSAGLPEETRQALERLGIVVPLS